jgi:hypothetical protein
MTEPFKMRQSTLTTFAHCPLSARFEIEAGERYSPPLSRGTLAHRCQEEILRTLHRQGERKMPQAEALEILYEVIAQRDVPSEDVITLTPEERVHLRQFVIRFCDWEWRTDRIMALEEQLEAEIVCPDGVVRVLTGTPDVLIANPAQSAVEIIDAKSGWQPPKTPRGSEDALTDTQRKRYLTERGMGQLDAYGVLVLRCYPAADKALLRELHPRAGEERTAALHRDELEHVERLIGTDLMLMDRALTEGPESAIWKAVGGTRQCDWCLGKMRCPRPAEERGAIVDLPMAVEYAQDITAITAKREQMLKMAKGFVDAEGPIPLPGGKVLGWQETKKDEKVRRSFCVHTPEPPEEDATDWAGAFEAQARANEKERVG